jgi:hypothetical protein
MPHTTPKLLWGSDRTVLPVTDGPDEFDDYNRTATPEQEQEAQEQLTRLFEVIDIWQVTDDQRDLVAQPGSPLAGDDRAVNPYHVSHAAIREIGGALDHLHSLRMLVQEARALHTYAPFTLNRVAIECSAIAVWLLAPRYRDERIRRRLVLETQNARDIDSVLRTMGETSTLDDDLDDIRKVAAKRPSLDGNGIVGTPKRVETMVREAGDAFDLGSEAALTAWKFCSGITHKRVWASINLLDREQLSHVANVGNYHVTASFKNVFAVTAISVVFSKEARRLFDLRAMPS